VRYFKRGDDVMMHFECIITSPATICNACLEHRRTAVNGHVRFGPKRCRPEARRSRAATPPSPLLPPQTPSAQGESRALRTPVADLSQSAIARIYKWVDLHCPTLTYPRVLVIRPKITAIERSQSPSRVLNFLALPDTEIEHSHSPSRVFNFLELRNREFAFPTECTRLVDSVLRAAGSSVLVSHQAYSILDLLPHPQEYRIERTHSPPSVISSYLASSHPRSRDWSFSIPVGRSRLSLSQIYSEESI